MIDNDCVFVPLHLDILGNPADELAGLPLSALVGAMPPFDRCTT
jgi:hypothetical protein